MISLRIIKRHTVLLLLSISLCLSGMTACKTTGNVDSIENGSAANQHDYQTKGGLLNDARPKSLKQVKNLIVAKIADHFYNHKTKPVINVCVRQPKINIAGEPELAYYLREEFINLLKSSPQCNPADQNRFDLDCLVSFYGYQANKKNAGPPHLQLLTIIQEPKEELPIDAFILTMEAVTTTPAYATFKKQHEVKLEQQTWPRIKVEAINMGSTFSAVEKNIEISVKTPEPVETPDSTDGSNETSGNETENADQPEKTTVTTNFKNYGTSGWYPINQQLFINGNACRLKDSIFFDGTIKPGRVELKASCQEGYWDAKKQYQIIGKKITKTIIYNLQKGDRFNISIYFIINKKQKEIRFKAAKI